MNLTSSDHTDRSKPKGSLGVFIGIGVTVVILTTVLLWFFVFAASDSKLDKIAATVGMECSKVSNPEDFFNNFNDETKANVAAREVYLTALRDAELSVCNWKGGKYAATDPDVISGVFEVLFSDLRRYSGLSEAEYALFEELCTNAEAVQTEEDRFNKESEATSVTLDGLIIFRSAGDEGTVVDLRNALEAAGFETGFITVSPCGPFDRPEHSPTAFESVSRTVAVIDYGQAD